MAPRSKLTLRSKQNTLNCCVWNVNGIKTKTFNKFEDNDFLRQIKGYDVIGLVETHLRDSTPPPLNKYKIYHYHRLQDANAKRNFGGITILVKDAISKRVTVLKSRNSNYQWVKFDKLYFDMQKDLYLCFVYVPPVNSTYIAKHGDQLDDLGSEIISFATLGNIIVCGDFNARTSNFNDYIDNGSEKYNISDEEYVEDMCCSRTSFDKVLSSRGKQLLDLCIQSSLRVLNGRTLGDFQGKFTSYNSQGSSVIDYVLCSEEFMSNILYMQVHNFTKSLSDHCKLSFNIGVNFCENCDSQNSQVITFPSQYIWNDPSISKFQSALQSINTMSKVQSFQNTQFDKSPDGVNEALSSINYIFIEAANRSLRKKPVKSQKKPLH